MLLDEMQALAPVTDPEEDGAPISVPSKDRSAVCLDHSFIRWLSGYVQYDRPGGSFGLDDLNCTVDIVGFFWRVYWSFKE